MYFKHDFICYSCAKRSPLTELKFTKDATGRTRRICQACELKAKEALDRLLVQQNSAVN